MMPAVLSIAWYTFLQQFRNRLYLVIALFGVLLLGVSLLFGAVAGDQEIRVLVDFGLATAEIFGLVTAVFGAVTLALEEMESRTIYLILTRPVPRGAYIAGRFLGLFAAVAASVLVMETLHLSLLLAKGWSPDVHLFLAIPFILATVMVMTAVALLCSLSSTSAQASVVFTLFIYALGHFGAEIKFLAQKSSGTTLLVLVKGLLFLIPDLTALNYKDALHAGLPALGGLAGGLGYAVLYSTALLAAGVALFSRKEF
jgi:ABC-type transport system involved in multi-copper enzyme maturation permease subunit